jgi:hypothetical protein
MAKVANRYTRLSVDNRSTATMLGPPMGGTAAGQSRQPYNAQTGLVRRSALLDGKSGQDCFGSVLSNIVKIDLNRFAVCRKFVKMRIAPLLDSF